jgi:hypothetical protein
LDDDDEYSDDGESAEERYIEAERAERAKEVRERWYAVHYWVASTVEAMFPHHATMVGTRIANADFYRRQLAKEAVGRPPIGGRQRHAKTHASKHASKHASRHAKMVPYMSPQRGGGGDEGMSIEEAAAAERDASTAMDGHHVVAYSLLLLFGTLTAGLGLVCCCIYWAIVAARALEAGVLVVASPDDITAAAAPGAGAGAGVPGAGAGRGSLTLPYFPYIQHPAVYAWAVLSPSTLRSFSDDNRAEERLEAMRLEAMNHGGAVLHSHRLTIAAINGGGGGASRHAMDAEMGWGCVLAGGVMGGLYWGGQRIHRG